MSRLAALLATKSAGRIRDHFESMIRRKAAAAGQDVETFLAACEREDARRHARFVAEAEATWNRDYQRAVIARGARSRGATIAWGLS